LRRLVFEKKKKKELRTFNGIITPATANRVKDFGNPVGEDCEKYMGKQLKPRPEIGARIDANGTFVICMVITAAVIVLVLAIAQRMNRQKEWNEERGC
jgi:mRNA-degrading endonuclease RelE of RelBE toxin-antitoxin system